MNLPSWSLTKASIAEREAAQLAFKKGTTKIIFHDRVSLKRWMDYQGWKRSWLFPEDSFFKALFANNKNFELALDNVIDLFIPKKTHHIPNQEWNREYSLDFLLQAQIAANTGTSSFFDAHHDPVNL